MDLARRVLARGAGESSSALRIRLVLVAATGLILAFAFAVAGLTWSTVASANRVGADFQLYVDASRGVLAGQGLYPAHQLAGPYDLADGDILYPPPIVLMMLPFMILPTILFWVIPLGIIAAVVVRHRPAVWSWPLLALGFAYPVTSLKIVHGNPTMWIVAAIALGTVTAGPAVFVLLKPTLAPFALIGVNRRRWWLVLGIAVIVAALFAPLWPDYITVLANTRGRGIVYSLDEVPFALVPVIAWIASPTFRWPRLPTLGSGPPAAAVVERTEQVSSGRGR
jgi:hypothetical protein